jgi:hypothetical protein
MNERLLASPDLDALFLGAKAVGFIDPWKEPVFIVLNETEMYISARIVVPLSTCDSIVAAASVLSSNRLSVSRIDFFVYSWLTEPLVEEFCLR